MLDSAKLQILSELRRAIEPRFTQKNMAAFFDIKDAKVVGEWERGRAKPAKKRRQRLIIYLWDQLGLRNDSPEFERVWEILVEEWEWDPLTAEEKLEIGLIKIASDTVSNAPLPRPPKPLLPPESSDFIGRSEELAFYQQELAEERFAVIAGPPGIGKTGLVSKLSRDLTSTENTFWFQCRDDDGIETVIWKMAGWLYYHNNDAVWQLLHNSSQPAYEMLDNLFEQLIGTNYILCFDDFHLLNGSKILFNKLFETARAKDIRFILTARQVFDLDWTLKIQPLSGLNRADTEMLLKKQGLQLGERLINEIHRRTEGNAQLLILAIQALQNATDIERLVSQLVKAELVEDFLLAEVDNSLQDEARLAMKGVSVLHGAPGTEDVIEEILDGFNVHFELLKLHKQYLLKATSDNGEREYFQHQIIQEYFYRQLGKQERKEMHTRAARYYEDSQDEFKAGLHLAYAGEDARAASYAIKEVRSRITQGYGYHVQAMLNQINEDNLTKEEQARIALAKGQVDTYLQNAQLAETNLKKAYELFLSLESASDHLMEQAQTCRELGFLLKSSAPTDAASWLQRGLSLTGDSTYQKADIYIQLADVYSNLGNMRAVQDALEKALELLPTEAEWLPLLAYIGLGKHYFLQNKLDDSQEYMQRALEMANARNDPFNMLAMQINLAALNQIKGQWLKAVNHYRDAQKLADDHGYTREKVRIYLNSGVLQSQLGERVKARELLGKALGIAQTSKLNDDWVASLGYLSDLAMDLADYQTAGVHLHEAEHLLESSQQNFLRPFISYLRSKYFLKQDSHMQALNFAEKSVEIAQDLGMEQEKGLALRIAGEAYAAQHETEHASTRFEESLALLMGNPYETARTKAAWGKSLLTSDSHDRGIALLREAQATFRTLSARECMRDIDRILTI